MGRIGKKVQGIKRIIGRHKIDRGEVKNSIGNGEAKELICRTPGHALRYRGENAGARGGYRAERNTEEKRMDNCNSIINIIHLRSFKK